MAKTFASLVSDLNDVTNRVADELVKIKANYESRIADLQSKLDAATADEGEDSASEVAAKDGMQKIIDTLRVLGTDPATPIVEVPVVNDPAGGGPPNDTGGPVVDLDNKGAPV